MSNVLRVSLQITIIQLGAARLAAAANCEGVGDQSRNGRSVFTAAKTSHFDPGVKEPVVCRDLNLARRASFLHRIDDIYSTPDTKSKWRVHSKLYVSLTNYHNLQQF